MCVAGANKVEGTISWLLGTNEILASTHDIAALKVKQGHFETAILVLHLPSFITVACVAAGSRTRLNHLYTEGLERLRRRQFLGLRVFRSIIFKYLHDLNAEYSDAAV